MDSGQFVKKFWTEIQAVMSTLSGRGGIKNWRVSANISFHLEKKHPRYELGNTAIDVGL